MSLAPEWVPNGEAASLESLLEQLAWAGDLADLAALSLLFADQEMGQDPNCL